MTKSLAKLEAQIAKLQEQANALRSQEVEGVIGRIKEAIQHYALTPADLFGKAAANSGKKATPKRSVKKAAPKVKVRDETGNTWSGIGKRPNWFKAALAAGKTAEQLLAN